MNVKQEQTPTGKKNLTVRFFDGGLLEMLATLFVGLKMTDNLDWSWWLVLSPIWGQALFAVFLHALNSLAGFLAMALRAKRLIDESEGVDESESN